MAVVNGTAVNFAFSTAAGITTTSVTGILLQEATHGNQSERVIVKNAIGNRVTSIHADQIETLRLRWVISGTNLAAAKTNTALRGTGLFINITACDEMPELVAANWEVISMEITGTNNGPKEAVVTCEQADGITAVAS